MWIGHVISQKASRLSKKYLKTDDLKLNQIRLAKKVILRGIKKRVRFIAGVDVAVAPERLVGCIGIFSFPELKLVEHVKATAPNSMPYVPGFLSYREIPVLIKCFKKIRNKPDLMLVDGQGIAHPRALGLASHLGVLLNTPTIGCAKSHLYGEFVDPNNPRGSCELLRVGDKTIGLVLRTRDKTKPLFISPGHLVDFEDCRTYVLSSVSRYRIPEPIRFAHMTAGEEARRFSV